MPLLKSRSANRLSALFTNTSNQGDQAPTEDPQKGDRSNKLYKTSYTRSHERLSSAQLSPQVAYPTPQQLQQPHFNNRPTVTHVTHDGVSVPPPPLPMPTDRPLQRDASPVKSRPTSGTWAPPRPHSLGPGIPSGVPNMSTLSPIPIDTPKSSKRRSLFGSSKEDKYKAANKPMAWIAGHNEKLPYNIALLLSGERVSCTQMFCMVQIHCITYRYTVQYSIYQIFQILCSPLISLCIVGLN
jgi:hypothetical protein